MSNNPSKASPVKVVHPVIPLARTSQSVRMVKPFANLVTKPAVEVDLDLLATSHQYFDYANMPFMQKHLKEMAKKKPYEGLKVLHNTHMTWSTIAKLAPLLVSGADVTVTVTKTLIQTPGVISLLKAANVKFISEEQLNDDDYDICLDCCADLCPTVTPKIGVVEQTRTGSIKYHNLKDKNFGIVSVDDCRTKKLETYFGTGNGFVRALKEYVDKPLDKLKFCLFGYGKVGHGIVNALEQYTNEIAIIETEPAYWETIKESPHRRIIHNIDKELAYEAIQQADVIVTATGIKDVISNHYDVKMFAGKILANMGSEDEFGYKFAADRILAKKRPINFTLQEPTLAKYLDPIFYLHNTAIDLLLSQGQQKGIIAIPAELDAQILQEWCDYHHESYDIIRAL